MLHYILESYIDHIHDKLLRFVGNTRYEKIYFLSITIRIIQFSIHMQLSFGNKKLIIFYVYPHVDH